MMGQAAGIAAAWASGGRRAVAETSTAALVRELKHRGAVLEPAPGMTPTQKSPGAGSAVDQPVPAAAVAAH